MKRLEKVLILLGKIGWCRVDHVGKTRGVRIRVALKVLVWVIGEHCR